MNASKTIQHFNNQTIGRIIEFLCFYFFHKLILHIFAAQITVVIAQLVRASDCGSEGRGFEPH